jgi:hypothetical protein
MILSFLVLLYVCNIPNNGNSGTECSPFHVSFIVKFLEGISEFGSLRLG